MHTSAPAGAIWRMDFTASALPASTTCFLVPPPRRKLMVLISMRLVSQTNPGVEVVMMVVAGTRGISESETPMSNGRIFGAAVVLALVATRAAAQGSGDASALS